MIPRFRICLIAAIALALAAAPLDAQNYRGAWTLYGGGIWFSDLNSNGNGDLIEDEFIDDDLLITEFASFSDLTLEPGWVAGTQLEWWFGNGRLGVRANGAYTERSFELQDFVRGFFVEDVVDGDGVLTTVGGNDVDISFGDVNVWLLNGDLMLRILKPERERTFAPFLTVGAGAVIYNPAGNRPFVVPGANAVFGDFEDDILFDEDPRVLRLGGDGNSETSFALDFGLGVDVLPGGWDFGPFGVGLRLEAVDHYAFDSPAEPLTRVTEVIDGEDVIVLRRTDEDFDGVHNIRFTAGALLTFGELFPEEEVAVAPAPPPPPEPEEEAISVCVVDPSLEGMLGYVDAVFRPATGDTLVTDETGRQVAFETVYNSRSPLYASNTNWYRSGEPMTFDLEDRTIEFVMFGGERIIEPDELTFIGTYRGTPIFADANDVMALSREARMLLEEDDEILDKLETLEEEGNMEALEEIGELDVVYVPVEPGCVFQPYRMTEEVRKVRG